MMEEKIDNEYKHHTFRVFKSENLTLVGNICVIIAAGTYEPSIIAGNQMFAEYFVLFPDKEEYSNNKNIKITPQRISYSIYLVNDYMNQEIKDKVEFNLEQAKEMCESAIQNFLNIEYKNSKIKKISWEQLKLIELEKSYLYGLWMRGKCKSELDEILKNSKCILLTRYIRRMKHSQEYKIQNIQDK